jgi:hypothetical protein
VFRVNGPASVIILEKGKPVERLGRKTKDLDLTNCGSRVAEGMLAVVLIEQSFGQHD